MRKKRNVHRLVTVQPDLVKHDRANWIVRKQRTISKHVKKDLAVKRARSYARKHALNYMVFFNTRNKLILKHKLGHRTKKKAPRIVKEQRKRIARPKTYTAHRAFKRAFKQLKKHTPGYSRSRIGRTLMKPSDIYEKQMVGRIQKQTGMTHFQIMNLINLDKHSDLVDIESEISAAAGHSKWKPEIYEHAKKNILGKLESGRSVTSKISSMGESELSGFVDYWEDQANQWNKQQKVKVNVNVI